MTNRAYVVSVENSTAVNVRVFSVSDCYQKHLFVSIKQMEDPDNKIRDESLSHITFSSRLVSHVWF